MNTDAVDFSTPDWALNKLDLWAFACNLYIPVKVS